MVTLREPTYHRSERRTALAGRVALVGRGAALRSALESQRTIVQRSGPPQLVALGRVALVDRRTA